MAIRCLFCNKDLTSDDEKNFGPSSSLYMCKRCGLVELDPDAASDLPSEKWFTDENKAVISITLRNEWENRGRKRAVKDLELSDIKKIVDQYRPMSPLEKMDNALIIFNKLSDYIGAEIAIDSKNDYPLYHCDRPEELQSIGTMLFTQGLIFGSAGRDPLLDFSITAEGYKKLEYLEKPGKDSKQCFVAMWFTTEMNDVFDKAIKPAIEFIEEGESIPRFEAVKIDNVEHANDINDEIIAQIRRSRFMVCDLTGYRGGVYFEAGFAYGLGLEVIYTCREDWTKESSLKNDNDEEVTILYDDIGNEIEIKKEEVHFDLAHRNRIEWSTDNLNDFKDRLENRIKALIY